MKKMEQEMKEAPKEIPALNDLKEEPRKMACSHEICLPIFAKSGMLVCGNCRKAILIAGQWFMFDREFPDEWML